MPLAYIMSPVMLPPPGCVGILINEGSGWGCAWVSPVQSTNREITIIVALFLIFFLEINLILVFILYGF